MSLCLCSRSSVFKQVHKYLDLVTVYKSLRFHKTLQVTTLLDVALDILPLAIFIWSFVKFSESSFLLLLLDLYLIQQTVQNLTVLNIFRTICFFTWWRRLFPYPTSSKQYCGYLANFWLFIYIWTALLSLSISHKFWTFSFLSYKDYVLVNL